MKGAVKPPAPDLRHVGRGGSSTGISVAAARKRFERSKHDSRGRRGGGDIRINISVDVHF